jgi:hypothetical protein
MMLLHWLEQWCTHQPWMLVLLQQLPWQWRGSVAGWACQQQARRCQVRSWLYAWTSCLVDNEAI